MNLRMPADKKEQLADLAQQHGRSLNQEINAAIEAWLTQHDTGTTYL
ncbi:Arc family DNA-binding protein, partial [Pseudescherichia sp.]